MSDPKHIYNWRRLDDRITTSGQPTEPQLAEIRAFGVRYIVNLGLHSHEKALPDEAASVSRLGMTYVHIPVDFSNPTDDDFAQFCSTMAQLNGLQYMSIASRTIEFPLFSIAIDVKCSAPMRRWRGSIWSKCGSPRACGQHSLVIRRRDPVSTPRRKFGLT
jgi:protein tyrosine phosphatase (PTP) superfamily phosphohydrolase (DUF442 family)